MASKSISKIITFSLAITFCLSALPVRVLADSSVVHEQVIKFYLDPALVTDMNFAKAVLPKYVADMNVVLAKNTNRRLAFDPESGILLTATKPQTDSASLPLPTEGFEIWAYAVQTTNTISYGGYAGMDRSGVDPALCRGPVGCAREHHLLLSGARRRRPRRDLEQDGEGGQKGFGTISLR